MLNWCVEAEQKIDGQDGTGLESGTEVTSGLLTASPPVHCTRADNCHKAGQPSGQREKDHNICRKYCLIESLKL